MKFTLNHFLPKGSTRAYRAGLLQGRAYRVLNAHLTKALFPYDLSIPEWKILGLLSDNEELKLIDIAKMLDVESPHVTKLLDKLEAKGFISKKSDTLDKRAKIVTSTKVGKDIVEKTEVTVKAKLKTLLVDVNALEMATYLKVLETIVKNG